MNKLILTFAVALLVASCGSSDTKAKIEKLKASETKLKTELAEIQKEIKKLTGDTIKVDSFLVDVMPLKAGIFKNFINVQGKVDADENVSIAAEMPGTITKINVKAGDEVSKGQVLAETDARAIQQSLSDLQTNLDLVNQLYEKQKNLWEQKIGTEVQFLQAKTQKESLEKKMSALQEQLRMTKIISPINGTVDAVDIKLGQLTAPGIPAIRVVNLNNLKIKAELAESYASRVNKGNEVLVAFTDGTDTLNTKVSFAAKTINPLNRTFTVEILLDNKKEYHPNMLANICINDYISKAPVISVPVKYIQKDFKNNSFVYVALNNKTTKKLVTTGKDYNGTVEILNGLSEGDLLITSGFDVLNENDALRIIK